MAELAGFQMTGSPAIKSGSGQQRKVLVRKILSSRGGVQVEVQKRRYKYYCFNAGLEDAIIQIGQT